MNIKEAEVLSGVSRQNIRFYEREGLITPDRNPGNDYREYSQEDIVVLKRIRLLRMLDMPLGEIRQVLSGEQSLSQAVFTQKERLCRQRDDLAAAIRVCDTLVFQRIDYLDEDQLLSFMEIEETPQGFFSGWVEDYYKLSRYYAEKEFSFIPDEAVTTPAEFTLALCRYGREHELNLVVTKEGMYPEFTIGGIEYTAERHYSAVMRVPVAVVRCKAKYPEDFVPEIKPQRRSALKCLRWGITIGVILLLSLPLFLQIFRTEALSAWEGILVILSIVGLLAAGGVRFVMLHGNDRTE